MLEHAPRPRTLRAVLASLAVGAMLTVGSAASITPAYAADYPSWADVLKARQDERNAKAEVARITGLIAALEKRVEETQEIAMQKGEELQLAEQDRDEAEFRAQQRQAEADDAQSRAEESQRTAGQLAARLARSGGGTEASLLFFRGDDATDLLSQLGMVSKLADQSQSLYDKATQDLNTATALTDQANVAKAEYQRLAKIAEEAFIEARDAAVAAADALEEQQTHIATLKAQLATLTSDRIHTEEEYLEGIREQWGAGANGEVSEHGWARPASGRITSPFGWRVHPVYGTWRLHAGTDLGASCNSPIFAGAGGTVTYAGWLGTYGNHIRIDHGGGITTSYSHIVGGGIMVHIGQPVGPGQQIARVGTTGASTGCHLHYEVHEWGSAIDSVPFMRARGIHLQ